VKEVVNRKIQEMDLAEYAGRNASTYSGGNKRKLSVAMAMIGRPLIVFLDEPSTGMDPVARRFMWQVISDITTKRGECCVILTTHSMYVHIVVRLLSNTYISFPTHQKHNQNQTQGGVRGPLHAHRHHGRRPPALPGARAAPQEPLRDGLPGTTELTIDSMTIKPIHIHLTDHPTHAGGDRRPASAHG
jgi:ABC-type microcin C transport system duplicated ATPase subunit YejF